MPNFDLGDDRGPVPLEARSHLLFFFPLSFSLYPHIRLHILKMLSFHSILTAAPRILADLGGGLWRWYRICRSYLCYQGSMARLALLMSPSVASSPPLVFASLDSSRLCSPSLTISISKSSFFTFKSWLSLAFSL